MKIVLCLLVVAAIGFYAACAPALAAPVAQAIPEENRIRSVEEAQAIYKAEGAEEMIEEQGEAAFEVFRADPEKWLGEADGIYVIDANEGSENEGVFIIYPPKAPAGKRAPDISRVRGKKLARETVQKGDREKAWLGFVEGDPDVTAQASTLAITPEGKKYAVVVWIHTEQE